MVWAPQRTVAGDDVGHFSLDGQRALVVGLGVHGGGVGVARYLAESGASVIVTDLQSSERLAPSVAALSDCDITFRLGRHEEADLDGVDFVVRNPAVPQESSFIRAAEARGIPVLMEMSLFLVACPSARVVGITGTKGKTTTTTLTGEILRKAGQDVVVAGNLRVSALAQLPHITTATTVVLELSSFQLEGLDVIRRSPRVGAVTNLMADHLNRYVSMESYVDAKRRVFLYQDAHGIAVLNRQNEACVALAEDVPGAVEWFGHETTVPGFCENLGGWSGAHNLANARCAATIGRIMGADDTAIGEAVRGFGGVPYRQQLVRVRGGVRFINDTAATTPDATVAALASIDGPIVLIAGGADKGLDFQGLGSALARTGCPVTDLILLEGSATDRLAVAAGDHLIRGRHASFPEAVAHATRLAVPGGAVLLSPGCASFGMFLNEFDRGDQFNDLVRALAE
jgi:UDP-N-acetylmuramoylalanine--D-glutamate ligase